jgi:hypothetical protein
MDEFYHEKMELFFVIMEMENCKKIQQEKIDNDLMQTEEYRALIRKEIELLQKQKRLAEIVDL